MYPIKPLGKICEILLGGTPPRNDKKNFGGDFLWCSIRDMKTKYISDTNEKLTDLGVKNSNVKLLKEGTLFMSFKLSLGKLAFAGKDLYTNEAIAGLPIKNENELDKEFLYYILSGYDFSASGTDNSVKGATLNKAKLEVLSIPLPPLPTQKLIVQKLDSSFENIDKNINLTKENLKNLEELNKSVLEKVFSEGEYEMKKLGEVCDFKNGYAFKSNEFNEKGNGLQVIRIGNVLNLDKNIVFINENDKFNEFKLLKNDIIIGLTGTRQKRDYLLPGIILEDDKYYLNQRVGRLRVLDKLSYKFLYFYLKTDLFRNKIFVYETGTVNQGNLSGKDIANQKIPLPPLQKQKEIVSYLDEVFDKNKELKRKYDEQLKELEELKQSLLKDAFEGRLVKE